MAEGDGILYNALREQLPLATINFVSDTVKLALCSASYVPDIDLDDGYTDLTNECTNGLGYTTGGETVTGKTVTPDDTNDRTLLDCDDVTWTALGTLDPQPAWAVMYDDTPVGKYLLAAWELVKPTNGGDYTVVISVSPAAAIIVG